MSALAALAARYRAEIPEWGHLPAAMRYKRAMVEALGVEAAFAPVRDTLGLPHARALRPCRVFPLLDAVRGKPDFRLLWEGREAFERPAVEVRGAPAPGPLPGRGRAAWLGRLDEAVVRARSAFVLHRGRALVDVEAVETSDTDCPEFDPAVLHGNDGQAWLFDGEGEGGFIPEAFSLLARNAVDFGHWLTDYLPRYVMARLAGLPADTPLLVDAGAPDTVLEHLAVLAPTAPLLRIPPFEQRRVGRLWVAPSPILGAHYPRDFDDALWSRIGAEPRAMARLLGEWERRMGDALGAPTGRPRIFFARKPGNRKKQLLNREAVETLAAAHGFERVYPEDLPLVEQARLAHHAEAILAPEGSNALLSWFAPPGCRVGILSPPYTLPLVDLGAILAERGARMTVLAGPDLPAADGSFGDFWNDYRVEPATLEGWLRDLPR